MALVPNAEARKTKAELLALYDDANWRGRYLEMSDLRDFLRGCILSKGYTIPDAMNNAIHLSDSGSRITQTLHTKHKVPIKEARVMCFLELAYVEPLVDLQRTDPQEVRASINDQLLSRKILFPHAYGRMLYDKSAKLHSYETPRLSFEETLQLLDDTPIGVSQLGRWTTGPFGFLESGQTRWIPPRRRIPLYHCASIGCHQVHQTELETNHAAEINQHSAKLHQVLRGISEHPSDWRQFEAELAKVEKQPYNDRSQLATHWLLGDCLSNHELGVLLKHLLDESPTKGEFRSTISATGLNGRSSDIVDGRSSAELLQLLMLSPDEALVNSIDKLVHYGKIEVPGEEVRRPVLNAGIGTGRFALLPELSRLGIRFIGGFEDLAPLRLKRLIRRLYPTREQGDVIEFDWQLRGTDATTSAGKLEQFIRSNTPEQVVRRLVLATRANVITTCTELAMDLTDYENDELIVQTVLWKLGYPSRSTEDFNHTFWKFHDEMSRVSQTAGISAVVDESAVRSLATNYFVELEGLLDDCLAFVTWLLLLEHMSETEPFTYHVERDRVAAYTLLHSASMARDNESECVVFSERNELFALCRGFAILADHVNKLAANPGEHKRPIEELPLSAHGSDLKTYPFLHYELALDLTEASRTALVALLRETSRRLIAADVPTVRNSWQHYRRSSVPLDPLVTCLQEVAAVVTSLEAAGLCRLTYSHTGVSFDGWGRGFFRFEDARGREISIATPTTLDVNALPSPETPQYLVTSAMLSDSGDFVRCRREEASPFSLEWAGFPTRRHESKVEGSSTRNPSDVSEGLDSGP